LENPLFLSIIGDNRKVISRRQQKISKILNEPRKKRIINLEGIVQGVGFSRLSTG